MDYRGEAPRNGVVDARQHSRVRLRMTGLRKGVRHAKLLWSPTSMAGPRLSQSVPSEGGWGSPALGAVTVPSPSLPKASLLPVKDSALGRQPLAVIENAEKGAEYVGDSDKAKGRGSVGSIANSIGEPLDAGL